MQALISKYYGPTNSRGSRIKVTSWNGSITYSWDYRLDVRENHEAAAADLIADIKKRTGIEWNIVATGDMPDGSGYSFIIQ